MEGPKETAVGEERRRKASESKERKIRGAYPSMASLFQRMREALHLPKYQEVLAAIQADLHKAETNGSGACGDSKEEQDGCGNDGEERERPCEEERQDEQGRDSDAEQRSHIQETEETLEDAKGTAVTPDDAWWWFCANPPSFPFYEVYTEELVNLLATYLHRRICQRIGAVEVVENGHESAGGPSAHNGSEEQEKTLQARSGTAEAPGRQRRRAPSPLRILEVGAGTGLLARHITTALDVLLDRHPPQTVATSSCCLPSCSSSPSSFSFPPSPGSSGEARVSAKGKRTGEMCRSDGRRFASQGEPGGPETLQEKERSCPGKGMWYSYVASEARQDLTCVYSRVVFGDFRDILATYLPHICICSWMPFNIDWTSTFRNFSRVEGVPWRGEKQSVLPRSQAEGDEGRTEREDAGRSPGSSGCARLQDRTERPAAVHPPRDLPSCLSSRKRCEKDEGFTDEWKEMKQTGVEDYLLIGHAEFGLVGKPAETWGMRLPASVHLPEGVEFCGKATCLRDSDAVDGKSAPAPAGHKRQRRAETEAGCDQELAVVSSHSLDRDAELSRCNLRSSAPGAASFFEKSAVQKGAPRTASSERRSEIRQEQEDETERRCPSAIWATQIEGEEDGRGVQPTSADVPGVPSATYRANEPPVEVPADCEGEEDDAATLLPLQKRPYWREGYTRVWLDGSDGLFQCSRFDAVESIANGGTSSSRVSIFRKRTT